MGLLGLLAGRPDMAAFSFTKDIVEGRPIDIFQALASIAVSCTPFTHFACVSQLLGVSPRVLAAQSCNVTLRTSMTLLLV